MTKIVYLRDKCIGCNSCVEHAPGYWEMAGDGKAKLINSRKNKAAYILDINESELDENKLAAESCPVRIIKIFK
jgi:ferredoxin